MISPMILVNAVYTIIDSFTSSSNKVMSYVAEVTSQVGNGNVLGSAMSWMYFIVVILIVAAIAAIMSAFVFYQRKE
jgi:subtilase family serine protease